MYLSEKTLDDLMHGLLKHLIEKTNVISARKGSFTEEIGCCLHLTNPRARLSRSEGKGKIFSALGEFLWYMSGENRLDFITYFVPGKTFPDESDDGVYVRGGYGNRLFKWNGIDQISNIITLLKQHASSRRAVIQLFDATDLTKDFKSIPCTCTLQFLARDGALHMFVSMRSNDAYIGLPHDVFAFTMLQEVVARSVGLELGEYKHCAGSMHLYEDDVTDAQAYLDEGFQSTTLAMAHMPSRDPWDEIRVLQDSERAIRSDKSLTIASLPVDEYWKDLIRLLSIFQASKKKDVSTVEAISSDMHSDVYKMFIQARLDTIKA